MTAIEAALTIAIVAVAVAILYAVAIRAENSELCEKKGGTLVVARFSPSVCIKKDSIIS